MTKPLLAYPLRVFLDLSTGHLKSSTRDYLEAYFEAEENLGPLSGGTTDFGWFLYCRNPWIQPDDSGEIAPTPEDLPPDLVECLKHAFGLGCDYVLFDADAEPLVKAEGGYALPFYEDGELALANPNKAATVRPRPPAPATFAYFCPVCGSAKIHANARAVWDVDSQRFVLEETNDLMTCDDCGEQTQSPLFVNLAAPDQSLIAALAAWTIDDVNAAAQRGWRLAESDGRRRIEALDATHNRPGLLEETRIAAGHNDQLAIHALAIQRRDAVIPQFVVIHSAENPRLCWSQQYGWVDRVAADVFTGAERDRFSIPGQWISAAATAAH